MIRLYVDSRDRVTGSASNFAINLPESVVVTEETNATIDRVLIPHSWYLIDDHNNRFYITEQTSDGIFHRVVYLDHGNYDKGGLSFELMAKMNQGRHVTGFYQAFYIPSTDRILVTNFYPPGEALYVYTKFSLLNFNDLSNWGARADDLRGVFAQIGMLTGSTLYEGNSSPDPITFHNAPDLSETRTQLFIKGNLGLPGVNHAHCGGDVMRRVVVHSPRYTLIYDAAKTDHGKMRVGPGSYTVLWFKLVDYDGYEVDLQGGEWSFFCAIETGPGDVIYQDSKAMHIDGRLKKLHLSITQG